MTRVRVKSKIPQYSRQSLAILDITLGNMARDVEMLSKVRTPVKTGRLQTSGRHLRVSPAHWKVEHGAEYAIYVHQGTYKMRARPFLKGAFEVVSQKTNDYIKKAIRSVIL